MLIPTIRLYTNVIMALATQQQMVMDANVMMGMKVISVTQSPMRVLLLTVGAVFVL